MLCLINRKHDNIDPGRMYLSYLLDMKVLTTYLGLNSYRSWENILKLLAGYESSNDVPGARLI